MKNQPQGAWASRPPPKGRDGSPQPSQASGAKRRPRLTNRASRRYAPTMGHFPISALRFAFIRAIRGLTSVSALPPSRPLMSPFGLPSAGSVGSHPPGMSHPSGCLCSLPRNRPVAWFPASARWHVFQFPVSSLCPPCFSRSKFRLQFSPSVLSVSSVVKFLHQKLAKWPGCQNRNWAYAIGRTYLFFVFLK